MTQAQPTTNPRGLRDKVEPEWSSPQEEDEGIEIDNAIERPREGQPGQHGPKSV